MGTVTTSVPELSIVLNVHHEGRLIHPTAVSIAAAAQKFIEAGGSAELIVVLDNPNDVTREYVNAHLAHGVGRLPVTLCEVTNGDLGLSRNSGVAQARGTYIAFCDADNLVSPTWFSQAVSILRVEPELTVVHPAFILAFEARDTLWKIKSTRDEDFDPRVLAQSNYWDATCVTTRQLAQKIPYVQTRAGQGFGPEDWHWNLETLVAGAEHVVAPETVLFYRAKRSGSLLSEHESTSALLPRSAYLASLSTIDALQPPSLGRDNETSGRRVRVNPVRLVRSGARGAARTAYRAILGAAGDDSRVARALQALRETAGSVRGAIETYPQDWGSMPDWLLDEWRAIHATEPQVFPETGTVARLKYWNPTRTIFADVYWELIWSLTTRPSDIDYLVLVPWLSSGGAAKVALNYVDAIAKLDPNARIVVLATESGESPWADQLPANADFVQVPEAFHAINGEDQERLLSQVVVQLAPSTIHLINSHVGFRVVERYGKAVSTQSKIFASAFTLDIWPSGRTWHYLLEGIRDYIDVVEAIFVDNEALRRFLIETFALPEASVVVHPQPHHAYGDPHVRETRDFTTERKLKVLWAGRYDRQKRLDVLADVAVEAHRRGLPVEFHSYGASVIDGGKSEVAQARASGVNVHGSFDRNLSTLGLENFDVFMMTSQWEGLPITLMEAMSQGIPVVAPAVGGIGDILNPETGHLVERFDDVSAYVDALEDIVADYDRTLSLTKNATAFVRDRHAPQAFVRAVAAAPNYIV